MAYAGLDELDAAIAGLEDLSATGLQRQTSLTDSSDDEAGPTGLRRRQKSLPDLHNPPAPIAGGDFNFGKAPSMAFLNLAAAKTPPLKPTTNFGVPPVMTGGKLPPPVVAPRLHSMSTVDDDIPPPPPPGGPPPGAGGAPALFPLKLSSSAFNMNSTYSYELANSSKGGNLLYETAPPRSPNVGHTTMARDASANSGAPHVPFTASVAQLRTPSTLLAPPAATGAGAKRIIEVVSSDGSLSKKLDITDDMTGMDLLNKFASKSRLEDSGYFALAVPEKGYSRWINLNLSLKAQHVPNKVVLKLQFIKTPKVFRDPVAIQFYWMQINEMIVTSMYPVSDYLVVKLAALSIQAKYGDYNPNSHKPGFFSQLGNNVADFVPAYHLSKYKLEYWEKRLFLQHSKYLGISETQARLEYIRVAKKSPSYGATLFEVMSGAHALVGAAEDGILLSRLKNSKCGDWTFYPFEKVQTFKKNGFGLDLSVYDNSRQLQVIKVGLQDGVVDAAFDCISDYYTLFKMRVDPNFVVPQDRFLPPLNAFEDIMKRTMLADFPSRLELFKEHYIKLTNELNSPPLQPLFEQLDLCLDLGRDCEQLNLNSLNMDVDTWQCIKGALLEAFSFKPSGPQIFVENFSCKVLKLAGNPKLGSEQLQALVPIVGAGFPVTDLDLSSNGLDDDKATMMLGDVISNCRNLQVLRLSNNKFGSKSALAILKGMKENLGFRILDVSGCDLKDLFCFPLALILSSHPSIQELDLSNNPIGDDGLLKLLEGIRRTKTLTKLHLNGTKIKSHSVKPLLDVVAMVQYPNSLYLSHTKLSDKTSDRIATTLAQRGPAGVVKLLDIQECQFSKKAMFNIFQSLETNQTLETLHVGGNEFDKLALAAFGKSIRANVTLKTFSMKGCSLGLEGYIEVANGIRLNAALTEFDISYNSMTALEIKKLADAVIFNRTLQSINVSYNPKITLDGVAAFMGPFLNNANMILSKVYMDGCGIGDDGAKRIGDMLSKNSSIERLSLKENNITTEGALLIFNGLVTNKRLGHLNIDRNDINFAEPKLSEVRNIVSATKAVVWESPKK